MPLINGLKMACEPCIRGHRSTKCTHANERLMVPVRKPGRPLSACPHPRGQTCSCGSITAAIPRRQACGCGSRESGSEAKPPNSSVVDLPSPSRATFKIVKPTQQRPGSSRKQSFDPGNISRMDLNQINIMPQSNFASNGYSNGSSPQIYGMSAQYVNLPAGYNTLPMQSYLHRQSIDEAMEQSPASDGVSGMNGYHALVHHNGMENGVEDSVSAQSSLRIKDSSSVNGQSHTAPKDQIVQHVSNMPSTDGGGSCCAPPKLEEGYSSILSNGVVTHPPDLPVTNSDVSTTPTTDGGSCCAPKKAHSQRSSTSSITDDQEAQPANCCSSKTKSTLKEEQMSIAGTPHVGHQMLPLNGLAFTAPFYELYPPQTTTFTYPATYGSFQNPLQPSAWRQNIQNGNYHPQPILPPGQLPFQVPVVPETLDTIHTCTCGDGCQCIGCAAHPYNDATQDYVRSAWESMSIPQPDLFNATSNSTSTGTNGNGNSDVTTIAATNNDAVPSPNAQTPSSTTSANGEEQSLSANDFFFVNYNFASDGCGGEMYSCPCGDDCQCLGCEVHKATSPRL